MRAQGYSYYSNGSHTVAKITKGREVDTGSM